MSASAQHSSVPSKQSLVEGDLLLRPEDFRRIASMLHADAGIYLAESKATLVYSRLAKRLRTLGLTSFRDYCDLVADAEGLDERKRMLVSLTTNLTSFFREPHHFDYLKQQVLQPLLQSARQGRQVRIWSAGCSRGMEPYSMAMTILSLMPDAPRHNIKILATDIDTRVLEEACEGVYDDKSLAGISRADRDRYFVASGDGRLRVADDLRRLVTFRELNLMGHWPMKAKFDAVFCRNVVIYFDEETQIKIWGRFAGVLAPGGLLCIGHSERVAGATLSLLETAGTTAYRLAARHGA